jgi:peptidoglycan-associated lipoprotein
MLASARGYLNMKETLETTGLNDSYTATRNFVLSPISKPVKMDNVFYEFGKWDITSESATALDALVKLLNDNPNITIELSAHTDLVGNASANKTLSEKRAQSVVAYLISKGIAAERLTPVGYGKEVPVVADKAISKTYTFIPEGQVLDEEFILTIPKEQQDICNQINRRTEFRVLKTTYGLY